MHRAWTLRIVSWAAFAAPVAAAAPALAATPFFEASQHTLSAAVSHAPSPGMRAARISTRVHPERESPATPIKADLSGRPRVGVASFYAQEFAGRPMANGAPMDPHGNNAASKTLPLGTVAKVTNLDTGKSAVVRIEDRGPYIKGRIVDLSPHTARRIGISRDHGIAPVVVTPIAVPLPAGGMMAGAAARHPVDGLRLTGDTIAEGSARR